MTTSIVLGVIFVLLAAAEIAAAYWLRELKERAGGGLTIGAIVTLIFGVRLLIQQAQLGIWLVVIVAVAQVVAVAWLIKLIRSKAEREDDDQPSQQATVLYRQPQPGVYGGHDSRPPGAPRQYPPSPLR